MNGKTKVLLFLAGLAAAALLTAGCGGSAGDKKSADSGKPIKIGATAGPHADVVHAVAEEAKKQGLKVEVVEFSDYITPDKALAEGDLDLNSYQHAPFLANFNKQNGTKLVPIGNTILMRMGIYSDKIHDLKAIPEGATVAIPNDPTNGGRGLVLLEKAGLIKLKNGDSIEASVADITENPKNLQFVELDAAQTPRSLDDTDIACVNTNYAIPAGLNPKKDSILVESIESPYACVFAVRQGDENNETYKKVVQIYQSEAIKKFINDKYQGTILPAF